MRGLAGFNGIVWDESDCESGFGRLLTFLWNNWYLSMAYSGIKETLRYLWITMFGTRNGWIAFRKFLTVMTGGVGS